MKNLLLFCLVCCSCSSTKVATQTIEHITVDTVYLSNVQYDSIYIYKDKLTDRTNDTIYVKDVSVVYRYILLRDTVYRNKEVILRDSIPYEVTKIVTKELTRPLTWFNHLTRAIFWLLCGALLVRFVKFVFDLKSIYANSRLIYVNLCLYIRFSFIPNLTIVIYVYKFIQEGT